jgi:hypothetical protein
MPSQELDTAGHENVDDREKVAFDYEVSRKETAEKTEPRLTIYVPRSALPGGRV